MVGPWTKILGPKPNTKSIFCYRKKKPLIFGWVNGRMDGHNTHWNRKWSLLFSKAKFAMKLFLLSINIHEFMLSPTFNRVWKFRMALGVLGKIFEIAIGMWLLNFFLLKIDFQQGFFVDFFSFSSMSTSKIHLFQIW